MTKEERLKKCEAVYDMGHITDGEALQIALMMCDFSMRFWDCVLIDPEVYDMFYQYIKENPKNAMHSILTNMEDVKHYFKPESDRKDKETRGEKTQLEGKRLSVNKNTPSLYNPIMMLNRLLIPCVKCACDPEVRETRRSGFHLSDCKQNHK